jgi:hypothetical protein
VLEGVEAAAAEADGLAAGVEGAAASSGFAAPVGRLVDGVAGLGAAWPAISNWSALSPADQRGGVALALPPGAGVVAPVFAVTLFVKLRAAEVAESSASPSEEEVVSSWVTPDCRIGALAGRFSHAKENVMSFEAPLSGAA